MSRTVLRLGVTALTTAAVSAAALAPSPALASSISFSKSSGTYASVDWVEVGELPEATGVPGNGHVGFLNVEQAGRGRGNAFGVVFDLQCPVNAPVVLPHEVIHPGPDAPVDEDACQIVLIREMQGIGMAFTMDKKFNRATLTGVLSVGDHGGTVTGEPPVDITWTGTGTAQTFTETSRYSDGSSTGTFRFTSTSRKGIIAKGSKIGPMIFDDEAGERSSGRLGSFRNSFRNRTR